MRDIKVKKILDSRGEATIEVSVLGESGRWFSAGIPSGKSKGKEEVKVFSYTESIKSVKRIKDSIVGMPFKSINDLDRTLLLLDGTKDKSKLGGNVMLGISIAYTRLLAFKKNKEVWEILKEEFFPNVSEIKPLIFSNLINGGKHSKNNLSIQEYMVVLKTEKSFVSSIERLEVFYKFLGKNLEHIKKIKNILLGDEGGYSLDFKNDFEPLEILQKQINDMEVGKHFSLAIDVAASSFFSKGKYYFNNKKIKSVELLKIYEKWFENFPSLMSIEDPFEETDEKDFKRLYKTSFNKWVVGDDITASHPALIDRYAKFGSINAVIIKPNQVGTVSEACEAINVARENKIKTIVSHRSGETEDEFIIHLAKAGGVDAVKIGAPVRERVLKFNEVVRLWG